jgi:hypothetical protein
VVVGRVHRHVWGICKKNAGFLMYQGYYNEGGGKIKVKEEKGQSPFSLTHI